MDRMRKKLRIAPKLLNNKSSIISSLFKFVPFYSEISKRPFILHLFNVSQLYQEYHCSFMVKIRDNVLQAFP